MVERKCVRLLVSPCPPRRVRRRARLTDQWGNETPPGPTARAHEIELIVEAASSRLATRQDAASYKAKRGAGVVWNFGEPKVDAKRKVKDLSLG